MAKEVTVTGTATPQNALAEESKRAYIKQSDLPNKSLQSALRIAQALNDEFGKRAARPILIAQALNISPTSGNWRSLCGASIGYGLTQGGYNADQISLTEMGRRTVAPTEEGMREHALKEAALKPSFASLYMNRYDGSKLPREEIAKNVLVEIGCPAEEAVEAVSLIHENARYAGLLREIKGDVFVDLSHDGAISTGGAAEPAEVESDSGPTADDNGGSRATPPAAIPNLGRPTITDAAVRNSRVFISHGANRLIVEHVKKVLKLAKLDPIVATEEQTPSKPVPEKVLDSMRKCSAGVIHVANEMTLYDANGVEFPALNPNVLIEIGAAMALYENRYVLLVEEGVKLPSNLQGLYRCEYKGNTLDVDALLRLLEIVGNFN